MERQNKQYREENRFESLSIEQKILERTSGYRITEGKSAHEALAELNKKIGAGGTEILNRKSANLKINYRIYAAAAVIVLIFALWALWRPSRQTSIIAEKGSHTEYRFPDGSVVSLNADSKVTYSVKDFADERIVNLEGEAFFDIVKGEPFLVSTRNGDVKVLGTTFNVYTRDNTFRVSCLTGKVLVTAGDRSVTISPGESAETSGKDLISYGDDNIDKLTGWINGEFYFENSSLNSVFEEIERQFNVKFEARDLNAKFFTGSFTDRDLVEALDIVCIPMGLKYEIGHKGKIFITEI